MASIFYVAERGKYRVQTWNAVAKKRGPGGMFATFEEADAFARKTEQDIRRAYESNGIDYPAPRQTVTFAAYARAWRFDGRSAKNYHYAANKLASIWPTQTIDAIKTADVKAMMLDLSALSASRRQTMLVVARHIFTAAVVDGLRPDDPTAGIKAPRTELSRENHRPVADAELERILTALVDEWMRAAVLLARDSGLRIGEVAGLKWWRVDLDKASLIVADVRHGDGTYQETPKGRVPLPVALTPRTVEALRGLRQRTAGTSTDLVFRHKYRNWALRAASQNMIRARWEAALTAAEIDDPRPRFHDLRHTRGQSLADAGVPLYVIQDVLRHKNPRTTRVYVGDTPVAEMARWMAAADGRPVLAAVQTAPESEAAAG